MAPSAFEVYQVVYYLYLQIFIIYRFSLNRVIQCSCELTELLLHVEIMTEGEKKGLLWTSHKNSTYLQII